MQDPIEIPLKPKRGHLYRAYWVPCIACDRAETVLSMDRPMTQKHAQRYLHELGWKTHRGKWVCPECAKRLKAGRA